MVLNRRGAGARSAPAFAFVSDVANVDDGAGWYMDGHDRLDRGCYFDLLCGALEGHFAREDGRVCYPRFRQRGCQSKFRWDSM
jgi:hypothetical protein